MIQEESMMSKRRSGPKGARNIRLTPKAMDIKEGEVITRRWAARETDTNKTVYVYSMLARDAYKAAATHFRTIERKIVLEPSGHIEWRILDHGLKTERAVQYTVFYANHDVTELVDRQYDFTNKKKKS